MVDIEKQLLDARILIVEDDKNMIKLLTKLFNSKEYKNIKGVLNGKEALKEAKAGYKKNQPFDILIVDLMLPDMSGHDVYKQIREIYPVPVIIITAREEKKEKVQAFSAGADDSLVKPIALDLLFLKTERILAKELYSRELINSHRRNQRLFLNLLSVMAKILEAKDFYTQFHSENVSRYARLLAEKCGFNKEDVEKIGIAGILHDFGTIIRGFWMDEVAEVQDRYVMALIKKKFDAKTLEIPLHQGLHY